MATITGSKRLLNISSEAMAASNSMTYGGLNVATESYVSTQIANLVSSAPATLDTLNELAAALGDDPNFATTMTNALAGKLATTHDMTLTLNGDASGSATFTNMGNATLTVTVANDSHTHDGRYYTESEVNTLLAGKLSTSGKAADSNLLDGLDSSRFLYTSSSVFSGDWNTLTDSDYEIQLREVQNITSGAHSNYPTGVYTYGSVLAWQLASATFALYASHTGDLVFQTGWNNDGYSGWRQIWHTGNFNPSSYLTTSGKAADSNLLDGIDSSAFLRSNTADTASGLITFTGGVKIQGGSAGDAAASELIFDGSNSPQIKFRDSDTGEDDFYIHVNSNNFYILADRDNSDGWDGQHPMQLEADTNSAYFFGNKLNSAAYAATSDFDAAGSAAAVNDRIDNEVIPVINTKADTGHTHSAADITSGTLADARIASAANWNSAYNNYITGLAFSGTTTKTLTLTQRDGGTISASFTDLSGAGGDGNDFLTGITKSGNTLTFAVSNQTNPTYTFGSNAFTSYSNHVGLYDSAGAAAAVNDRIDTEVFDAIATVDGNIPTNNNQLTNGAGYITSSSLPSSSQLVKVYNNVNYVPSGDAAQRGNYGQGVTVYEGYSGGTNRPFTYDTTAQFMSTTQQGFEISVDWVSNSSTPMKVRHLRDCCQGWSPWINIWTEANFTGTNISNWNTAYGWGNHASAGYLTAHPSISAASSSDNSGRTYIQDITLDSNGHVTGITTATETVTNTDTNYYLNGITRSGNTLTFAVNGATNQTYTFGSNAFNSTTIPTNNNQLTNGAGYITGYTVTGSDVTTALGYTPYQENTALSATTGTFSGDVTVNGNQVITSGSNADVKFSVWSGTTYGIGMTSGVTYGGLNDYAMTFCMNNDTDRGFWWGYSGQTKSSGAMSLTTAGVLTVASSITAGGDITAFSDIRVKENIEDLEGSLDKVTQLRGVSYNKIGSEEKSIGVIAQEIQEVLPEVVREGQDGMLSVAYGNITAVLIEAIKEQQEIISQLEERIVDLENRM